MITDTIETVKMVVEPVNNVLNPPAKVLGNTIAALLDIILGRIENFDEKLKLKRQKDLQAFKDTLENEVAKIPEQNRIEPKLSIAGPALEASKYFIEEESLRSMFAKLLANSMNKDTSQYVQTSFVEIIKQMSPLDAKNISELASYIQLLFAE
jgi:hypothetical protein